MYKRQALTRTFNDYARKNKLLKDSESNLSGEDIREGLTAIISVKISEPQFGGQTKHSLGNTEAKSAVDGIVSERLTVYLEQNPQVAKMILDKSILAQRAREAEMCIRDRVMAGLIVQNIKTKMHVCIGFSVLINDLEIRISFQ